MKVVCVNDYVFENKHNNCKYKEIIVGKTYEAPYGISEGSYWISILINTDVVSDFRKKCFKTKEKLVFERFNLNNKI